VSDFLERELQLKRSDRESTGWESGTQMLVVVVVVSRGEFLLDGNELTNLLLHLFLSSQMYVVYVDHSEVCSVWCACFPGATQSLPVYLRCTNQCCKSTTSF
jgi:hypothetical protein